MEATFRSNDPLEIKRIAKSTDLALCLWEILHNGWRQFEYTDYDYKMAWDKIKDIVAEYKIDVDDLIE